MKKLGVIILICLSLMVVSFNVKKLTPFFIPIPSHVASRIGSMNFPSMNNPMSAEGVALGRTLFYDKNLSGNKNISCGSCHMQQFAFTDTAQFSKGFEDKTGDKNSMSLVNLGWNTKFFWDGRVNTLLDQIHDPIIDQREMANTWADVLQYLNSQNHYKAAFNKVFNSKKITDNEVKKAIEQFIVTIISFNTPFDDYYYKDNNSAISDNAKKGLKLFFGKARCGNCHNSILLTNQQFMNNGLDSIPLLGLYNGTLQTAHKGLFKTPTLRNIGLTSPYMHDGRFKNLEEVLHFYNNNVQGSSINLDFRMQPFIGGLGLDKIEINQIIEFLHTLTDSSLINNPAYSDPNIILSTTH